MSDLLRNRRTGVSSEYPPYHVFTTAFDQTVHAGELGSVLGPLSPEHRVALDEAWTHFMGGLNSWRTGLQVAALDTSTYIRGAVSPARLADTAVTLLIDHSGSMRGLNMLMAAAAADIFHDFLRHLGCSVEILGFTTSSWKGGHSRSYWRVLGSPVMPGRLCDILHIIYRSADSPHASSLGYALQPMLRPDLPKENVDGEALEWAAKRLTDIAPSRKILIVLSDGAPVDDSTLHANDKGFLDRHLRQVIAQIRGDGAIELCGHRNWH